MDINTNYQNPEVSLKSVSSDENTESLKGANILMLIWSALNDAQGVYQQFQIANADQVGVENAQIQLIIDKLKNISKAQQGEKTGDPSIDGLTKDQLTAEANVVSQELGQIQSDQSLTKSKMQTNISNVSAVGNMLSLVLSMIGGQAKSSR